MPNPLLVSSFLRETKIYCLILFFFVVVVVVFIIDDENKLTYKPNTTRSINESEISHLFETNYLASDNPVSLQSEIWLEITNLYSENDSPKLKFVDINLCKDPLTKNV